MAGVMVIWNRPHGWKVQYVKAAQALESVPMIDVDIHALQ